MNSALNLTVKTNFKQSPLTWIMKRKTEKDDICLTVIKENKICKVIKKSSLILSAFSCSSWYACELYKNIQLILSQMLENAMKYLFVF